MIVAYIDNERVVFDPEETTDLGWATGLLITTENGKEYHLFESHEQAGEAAREYWEELVQDDPKEFICIVGEDSIIRWGLNQLAAPGSVGANSLNEWLALWLDVPEEHFASYDGIEREFHCKHPDWSGYNVAYRHN